ncbi:MAG: CRISPR-associated protein Cst2 [Candidatus Atribacteria bacterium]|nr:CRISPR-associated protein Cst2 [Candidatus Atribacteria bacterium]
MERKALALTVLVKAFSLNYDEGYGNVAVLKKVHRGSGETYLFASRQSLRYSIGEWCFENVGWKRATPIPAGEGNKQVIQFNPEELEKSYFEEADLFGYMITTGGNKTRSAVARLTHMIALEPYCGDQELLNNKGFADRIEKDPNLANIETGYGYYKYSLAVDLDRVGEDKQFNISLATEEKIKRVCDLLEAIKFLYRDIKGRREDLNPLFVIGGIYPIKSLFWHNAVDIYWRGSKACIKQDSIEQVLNAQLKKAGGQDFLVRQYTRIGRYSKRRIWK